VTTTPSNPTPFSPLPGGLDESDLLALIEGTPIPAERAARLREALANDPRLAELAALMRADRDAVASLPPVAAPADLLDRVEVLLEREALVGLARTEASSSVDSLPISAVIPTRRPWLTLRTGAPIAAAAAVLLIAGGVLMLVPGNSPHPAAPKSADPLANSNGGVDHPGSLANSNTHTPPVVNTDTNAQAPGDLANNTNTATPPAVAIEPEKTAPTTPAVAQAAPAPAITPEALLAAASEGRLVLRLRTADAKAVMGRVDDVRRNARAMHVEAMNTVATTLTRTEYVKSWTPRNLPGDVKPKASLPEPAPIANGGNSTPGTNPPPGVTHASEPSVQVEPSPKLLDLGYVASVPATLEGLDALLKLRTDVVGADWQILSKPLAVDAPADSSSILWWASPPSTWTKRFTVPIVVQSN
jgi:hypothetical protein